jgi:uncharacterized protein
VLELDTKQVTETGEFEGYASTWGNVDLGGDIMRAGAFDESLRTRPTDKVKMLWQHDTRQPIGKWLQLSSDNKGLYARGQLLLDTNGGKETYAFMKAGAIDGLSVGYRTIESEYDSENDIRTITKANLMEVSVVTFPMNEMATVSSVKQYEFNPRMAEKALRDAGFSSSDAVKAIAIMKKYLQCETEVELSSSARDESEAMLRLLEAVKATKLVLSS